MERKFSFAPGEYYHVYNRGVEKRKIFLDDRDYKRFVRLIYLCNSERPVDFSEVKDLSLSEIARGKTLVQIGSYCLMPNHFHILIREKSDQGISKFLGKVLTAYSMYFNKRYERGGRLFENKFQAQHADGDEYLKYLFAYIHLNPIKLIEPKWKSVGLINQTNAKKFISSYTYSSYLDYLGHDREEKLLLDRSQFPEYFSSSEEFENYLSDWLSYGDLIA